MAKFYLLRHAATRVLDGDFFGAGISEKGLSDARALARSGVIPPPESILSSPYRRAMETARVFGDVHGLEVRVAPWLAEWQLQAQNLDANRYAAEAERGW